MSINSDKHCRILRLTRTFGIRCLYSTSEYPNAIPHSTIPPDRHMPALSRIHQYHTIFLIMKIFSIYRIQNITNNKVYIGYSENVKNRIAQHKRLAMSKRNVKSKLYAAMKKYGIENFTYDVIYQSLDMNHCKTVMETFFISEYDSYDNGYNMTFGGEGIDSISNSMYSKIRWESDEYRSRLLKSRDGIFQTDEYRQKQSEKSMENWKDETYRESVRIGVEEYWDDVAREEHSQKLKKVLSSPEQIKRLSENAKKCWDIPGYRENQRQKQSDLWKDTTSKRYKNLVEYIVTDPSGKTFRVKGLKQFIHDNKLDGKAMYKIANGKKKSYKGWTVVKLTE